MTFLSWRNGVSTTAEWNRRYASKATEELAEETDVWEQRFTGNVGESQSER